MAIAYTIKESVFGHGWEVRAGVNGNVLALFRTRLEAMNAATMFRENDAAEIEAARTKIEADCCATFESDENGY